MTAIHRMKNRFRILATMAVLTVAGGVDRAAAAVQTVQPTDTAATAPNAPVIDYASPKRYVIEDIRIHGVRFLDPDILTASSGLQRGDTVYIPGKVISQAVKRLWSQRYFSDVKIEATPTEGMGAVLDIYLSERPRVYNWNFEGVRRGEATTLREDLKLRRGTELSDYVIDKNVYLIKQHFAEKGFRNADVQVRIANDSVIRNAVNVTFVIDKRKKVKIGSIDFEGNEVFTDRRLRRTMKKTHQKSINIFRSTKLKEDEYENDKDNVIDFYNSKGYRNANIVRDSVYPLSDNRIGIKLWVDEGNKYYFRNISWVGNTKYETSQLEQLLGIRSGDVYDKKTLHKRLGIGKEENPEDMSQIKSLYQNEGYLMSQIDPSEIIVGPDSIDLEIKVFEGKPFTINEVIISGNNRLNDEVIRREISTRPGELYNRALIMQTMRQLAQMQHFDQATLMPQIMPVSNDEVNIGWPLTETASDKFEVSGGWGAGMFVGAVGVQFNNISIRNLFKKGAWRPVPQGQNQQLILRAQTNGTYYKSFMASFTEPWLGGHKPNALTVSAHYSSENDNYNIFRKGNSYFHTIGVAVGLGKRLSWPDQYFTLYTELSYTSYGLKNWNWFMINSGTSNILALRIAFGRNSVDHPIYPRRGSDISVSVALTPPYSLFDGKDYKNMPSDDPARFRWIEYHKWLLRAEWYYPLSRNNNLVLMARAEMGYLGHYNKYKPSPFEGFDVGGDGMSGYNIYGVDVIGQRGYEDGTITPYNTENAYANVYNKYTVELRYPIIQQPQSTIYGLVFAEAGNAFMSWKKFDPFLLKRAVGVGVRLYLPIVGMLGIDWGYGFDRTSHDPTKRGGSQIHFMIGNQF